MFPVSSQPDGLFAKCKRHMFSSISDTTLKNLKSRLAMDLTTRYTFNASKLLRII